MICGEGLEVSVFVGLISIFVVCVSRFVWFSGLVFEFVGVLGSVFLDECCGFMFVGFLDLSLNMLVFWVCFVFLGSCLNLLVLKC